MRYLLVFVLFVVGCSADQEPTASEQDPIVGTWYLIVPSNRNIVLDEDFEVWLIGGDGIFVSEKVNEDNICVGKSGTWSHVKDNSLRIERGSDESLLVSYKIEEDEMTVTDQDSGAKTIWKKTEDVPLIVMLNRGYCTSY